MLVRPHSKIVLREAIKNDSDFLSRSNIMDYSYDLYAFTACRVSYAYPLTDSCSALTNHRNGLHAA
jgi:hypothetical protein